MMLYTFLQGEDDLFPNSPPSSAYLSIPILCSGVIILANPA